MVELTTRCQPNGRSHSSPFQQVLWKYGIEGMDRPLKGGILMYGPVACTLSSALPILTQAIISRCALRSAARAADQAMMTGCAGCGWPILPSVMHRPNRLLPRPKPSHVKNKPQSNVVSDELPSRSRGRANPNSNS